VSKSKKCTAPPAFLGKKYTVPPAFIGVKSRHWVLIDIPGQDCGFSIPVTNKKGKKAKPPLKDQETVPSPGLFGEFPPGSFPAKLEELINCHSIENGSNTPDFILAEYMRGCLDNFDTCVRAREKWYGREND